MQLGGDWEEGLPGLLLAAREVVQKSIGFSPNNLVFGHTVHGPVASLKQPWTTEEPPQNVFDFVNGF